MATRGYGTEQYAPGRAREKSCSLVLYEGMPAKELVSQDNPGWLVGIHDDGET